MEVAGITRQPSFLETGLARGKMLSSVADCQTFFFFFCIQKGLKSG